MAYWQWKLNFRSSVIGTVLLRRRIDDNVR